LETWVKVRRTLVLRLKEVSLGEFEKTDKSERWKLEMCTRRKANLRVAARRKVFHN
jgi:hypothetical protein